MIRLCVPRTWPTIFLLGTALSCTDGTLPTEPAFNLTSDLGLNVPPVAHAGGPYSGTAGTPIMFDGRGSSDVDGHVPLTYAWSFGDGSTGTGVSPTHSYAAAGVYVVTLTVTDAAGQSSLPAVTAANVSAATAPPSNALVIDSFSRVVAEGWGNADVGGNWFVSTPGPTFRVDGARGIVEVSSNQPQNAVGRALETYGRDVEGLISFSLDRAPDVASQFHTVQVYARRDDRVTDGDNYYRYRVRVFGNRAVDIRIEKNVDGVLSFVTDNIPINVTFSPGAQYRVRWQAVGTSPSTTVRMRVWQGGTVEPTTWQASAVVDEPALDDSGTTGVRFQGPGADQVSWPVRLSVDDLAYIRLNP
jgi:PKD repeat protein